MCQGEEGTLTGLPQHAWLQFSSPKSLQWRGAKSGFPVVTQTVQTPMARAPSGSMNFIVCVTFVWSEVLWGNIPECSLGLKAFILLNVGIQSCYLQNVDICCLCSLSFRINQRYPPKKLCFSLFVCFVLFSDLQNKQTNTKKQTSDFIVDG